MIQAIHSPEEEAFIVMGEELERVYAQEDQYANVFGREQGRKFPNKDSKELVKPLRPDKLNERY
jgi:hypothetical protein